MKRTVCTLFVFGCCRKIVRRMLQADHGGVFSLIAWRSTDSETAQAMPEPEVDQGDISGTGHLPGLREWRNW